VHKHQKRSVN